MKTFAKWLVIIACLVGVVFWFRSCPYNRSNSWEYLVQIDFKYSGDDSITTVYYKDRISFNATVKYIEPEYYWTVCDLNGDNTCTLRITRTIRKADGSRFPTHLNVELARVPNKDIDVINVTWKLVNYTEE